MLARPVDSNGDVLPVRLHSQLLSGSQAIAVALRDYLKLFQGDWWEYSDKGNAIIDLIAVSRCTDQDAVTLRSYLTTYIMDFPGIASLSGIKAHFSGHSFVFSCNVHTENNETVLVDISF